MMTNSSLVCPRIEPDIGDIIYLHSMINNARSSLIKKLILSLDKGMVKQILLIYLQFFFNANHRDKYIFNEQQSSIHTQIINTSKAKLTNMNKRCNKNMTKTRKYASYLHTTFQQKYSPMSKLSVLSISDCMSFLNQKDRSYASRINVKWFRASCSSIAKYHLKVTNTFINTKMIISPQQFQYDSVGSLEINKRLKYRKAKHLSNNYNTNLIKILSSPSLKTFKGEINKKMLPLFQEYLKFIECITTSGDDECKYPTKDMVLAAKTIKVTEEFSIWQNPYLWMNDEQSRIFSILYANEDIDKYIIENSNVQHLDLSNMNTFSLNDSKMIMCHPIYLLWNIPTLKSCKLNMTLPISNEFKSDCEELLTSDIIKQKSKNQFNFQDLHIRLAVNDTQSIWSLKRLTTDNKEFNKDYATFLEQIMAMNPNLKCLKCEFIRYQEFQRNIFEGELMIKPLDLKVASFNQLSHLSLYVATMDDAKMLLSELTDTKLETLALYIAIADLDTTHPDLDIDGQYGYVKDTINQFGDTVCEYLQKNWMHLHSFIINIDNRYSIHSCLSNTYWSVYRKYLQCLVNMIENECIYNGYLQFNVPTCINRIVWEHCHRSWNKYYSVYVWNKENKKRSLEIEKLIATIQAMMSNYNGNLDANDCEEKKIILNLPTLMLYGKHVEFLQFWFNNDTDLYNDYTFTIY